MHPLRELPLVDFVNPEHPAGDPERYMTGVVLRSVDLHPPLETVNDLIGDLPGDRLPAVGHPGGEGGDEEPTATGGIGKVHWFGMLIVREENVAGSWVIRSMSAKRSTTQKPS